MERRCTVRGCARIGGGLRYRRGHFQPDCTTSTHSTGLVFRNLFSLRSLSSHCQNRKPLYNQQQITHSTHNKMSAHRKEFEDGHLTIRQKGKAHRCNCLFAQTCRAVKSESGDSHLSCFGLREVVDVFAMLSVARHRLDASSLNMVSHGPQADHCLIQAASGKQKCRARRNA